MPLLTTDSDEMCPCGLPRKYKRCHGGLAAGAPPLEDASDLDVELLAFAYNVIELLQDAIKAVNIPECTPLVADEVFRKYTLLHFAKRIYRVTLAGITLTRVGQTTQAFTLKRDQHYAWVAFQYYFLKETESVLFMASSPLKQRDKAQEVMAFDDRARSDPGRQAQLCECEETAARLYERYPGLRVPKAKSGDTRNPVMIDWSEPSEFDMMEVIARAWPDEMRQQGEEIDLDDEEQWAKRETRRAHFYHSKFPSLEMHGNPMALVADLNEGEASELRVSGHDPNSLLYIYLWYPLGVASKVIELSEADGFLDRLIKLASALNRFRVYFGEA